MRALLRDSNSKSIEQTAYRVLILCEARRLSFFNSVRPRIDECIKNQVSLLGTLPDSELQSEANQVWVEKVSFGSHVITHSYRLAALKAATLPVSAIELKSSHCSIHNLQNGTEYIKLLKQTPLFASTPEWKIHISMLEASLFQPLLRRRRLDIFSRKNMAPDRYFDLIPLTWTSCNNRTGIFAPTKFIYDMMVISFLDFQTDEFMEAVAGPSFEGDTSALRTLIDHVFTAVVNEKPSKTLKKRKLSSYMVEDLATGVCNEQCVTSNSSARNVACSSINGNSKKDQVRESLTRFVLYIAHHPSIQSASCWDRNSTLRELRTYLHAHVTQSEDNAHLARTRSLMRDPKLDTASLISPVQATCSDSYFRWIRTTSGDHTACPYSFAFAGCLLSTQLGGVESFPSAHTKYLAAAGCQHLSAMCRMYNDYGSIARDKAECNLNSVDFLEFTNDSEADLGTRKKTLYELAQYERSWLRYTMKRLGDEMADIGRRREMEVWTMFCDVTDLYGQIYVVKDVASRMSIVT